MSDYIDVSQWHPIGKEFDAPYVGRLIEAVTGEEIFPAELMGRYNYLLALIQNLEPSAKLKHQTDRREIG